jgi:hypothetical protein
MTYANDRTLSLENDGDPALSMRMHPISPYRKCNVPSVNDPFVFLMRSILFGFGLSVSWAFVSMAGHRRGISWRIDSIAPTQGSVRIDIETH